MDKVKNGTVAFIPVRGGSKSIPGKNIKMIAGKPLVFWTIEAAMRSKLVEKVYISTDSQEIAGLINSHFSKDKVEVISRSAQTATDEASSESALLEFCSSHSFEKVVFIQATSPLLETGDIDNGLKKLEDENLDSILSVVKQYRFIWNSDGTPANYNPMKRPRRQEFDGFLVENGAFYISGRDKILESSCRISGKIGLYEMNERTYFEIDEPSDWQIVENFLLCSTSQTIDERIKKIKMVLTDCDGVLTDGGMYYGENGEELKKFHARDGMGFQLLRENGIKTAIVTGEDRELVKRRAEKVKADYLYMGVKDKEKIIRKISEDSGISLSEMAYIGDDINDIPAIKLTGLSATVSNGHDSLKKLVDIVIDKNGGDSAFRSFADLIIKQTDS